MSNPPMADYRAQLPAVAERFRKLKQRPVVLDVQGPAHDRHFSCAAQIDGVELGPGTGKTKKDAEQTAAKMALQAIEADLGE